MIRCKQYSTTNCYTASQSGKIGAGTLRCCICGSPRGGFASDGNFYCTTHMHPGEKILA